MMFSCVLSGSTVEIQRVEHVQRNTGNNTSESFGDLRNSTNIRQGLLKSEVKIDHLSGLNVPSVSI